MVIEPVAYISTDFPTKFGLPRQSGRVQALTGIIRFEPEYRQPEALRGIEGFSHIWLIWGFSRAARPTFSATVRPPRLGGNARMGVFATRSPFRPNGLALSCVRLDRVDYDAVDGPLIYVSGIDMANGSPVYDIKPYLPAADCVPEATGGFAEAVSAHKLQVEFPEELLQLLPAAKRSAIIGALAEDPRPAYESDPTRRYGVEFAGYDVRFIVDGDKLRVIEVEKLSGN